LEDDFGHPPGSFTHDLGAMDFMGASVMEFFKLLWVGDYTLAASAISFFVFFSQLVRSLCGLVDIFLFQSFLLSPF